MSAPRQDNVLFMILPPWTQSVDLERFVPWLDPLKAQWIQVRSKKKVVYIAYLLYYKDEADALIARDKVGMNTIRSSISESSAADTIRGRHVREIQVGKPGKSSSGPAASLSTTSAPSKKPKPSNSSSSSTAKPQKAKPASSSARPSSAPKSSSSASKPTATAAIDIGDQNLTPSVALGQKGKKRSSETDDESELRTTSTTQLPSKKKGRTSSIPDAVLASADSVASRGKDSRRTSGRQSTGQSEREPVEGKSKVTAKNQPTRPHNTNPDLPPRVSTSSPPSTELPLANIPKIGSKKTSSLDHPPTPEGHVRHSHQIGASGGKRKVETEGAAVGPGEVDGKRQKVNSVVNEAYISKSSLEEEGKTVNNRVKMDIVDGSNVKAVTSSNAKQHILESQRAKIGVESSTSTSSRRTSTSSSTYSTPTTKDGSGLQPSAPNVKGEGYSEFTTTAAFINYLTKPQSSERPIVGLGPKAEASSRIAASNKLLGRANAASSDDERRELQQSWIFDMCKHRLTDTWDLNSLALEILEAATFSATVKLMSQKISSSTKVEVEFLFKAILDPRAFHLHNHGHGSCLIKALFSSGTEDQCDRLALTMKGKIVDMSLQSPRNGSVQCAVQHTSANVRSSLLLELRGQVVLLAKSREGSHVIQVILKSSKRYPPSPELNIAWELRGQVLSVSAFQPACFVLSACLTHLDKDERKPVFEELIRSASQVSLSQYGQAVLWTIFKQGSTHEIEALCAALRGQIPNLSRQSNTSKLCQRAIQLASGSIKSQLLEEILSDAAGLMQHGIGNYVLQAVWKEMVTDQQKRRLVTLVDEELRRSTTREGIPRHMRKVWETLIRETYPRDLKHSLDF